MSQNQTRLQYLYSQFIKDEASVEEVREFWELMRHAGNEHPIKRSVFELYGDQVPEEIERKDWGGHLKRIMAQPETIPGKFVYTKWWAAASVILLMGIFSYFYFGSNDAPPEAMPPVIVKTEPKDIAPPASNRATITLADGQKIFLDSMTNGILARQNNVELKKTGDGQVSYGSSTTDAGNELIYNTLSNPRGSKVIDIRLSDGSHLWLNSGSSVTFPVAFRNDERKVTITGEAYFEIAHDPAKKFIVTANNLTTEVLGTHFNVYAFDDIEYKKVTLLQGSVKVISGDQSSLIKPGEQAVEIAQGRLKTNRNVNVEEVIAWKNEMFNFNDANIKDIMKEVSRWYDVDVEYKGNFSDMNFGGNMSRQKNVSELLKRLEATKTVRFEVVGKTITIIQIK